MRVILALYNDFIVLEKKQRMRDAMLTGQKIAIDIHYQDQMNSVVFISVGCGDS